MEIQGSLNQAKNAHPLGVRAKNIHLGIITIRFEMPYNVWCLHCDRMIGKGVRFNAEKKACGKYFSTTVDCLD